MTKLWIMYRKQEVALVELIEQTKILLGLLDDHDVIKKAYKDAYKIRHNQLVRALEQADEAIRSAEEQA